MKKLKSLKAAYQQLPLHWKINVPFIVTYLGIWTLGTVLVACIFSDYLERRQEQRLHTLSDLVVQEFNDTLGNLRETAQLLSQQKSLETLLADNDNSNWQPALWSFTPVLNADIIKIFDKDGLIQLSLRQSVLHDVSLDLTDSREQLLAGKSSSSLVSASDALFYTFVTTQPVNNGFEQVGGVLIGHALTNQKLEQIADRAGVELVVFDGNDQIASTFTERGERFDHRQTSQDISQLSIQKTPYLVKHIEISRFDNQTIPLLVLQSLEPLKQLQKRLWLTALGVTIVGSGVVITIGHWTARKITRPVQAITQAAQQVIQTSDFSQLISVTTQDEVGILATALNQLITWMHDHTNALRQSQTALNIEIEERSQALQQLKRTQTQLIQAEKMSSLGTMVAGIAHEINNPINFIYGNLKFIDEYTTDLLNLIHLFRKKYSTPDTDIQAEVDRIDLLFIESDLPEVLNSMKIGTDRVHEIVSSLRNFSRLDESEQKTVNLQDGIESTLLILNYRIRRGVKITKNYAESGLFHCYPAQLNQVFMNIITNALDALESSNVDSPEITICTEKINNQTIIRIKDNGPGIPEEIRSKIFDPFFTTKPVGQGTGLGLSICYQIVQKHYGTLSVESVFPQGTEFFVALPA
ncbi:MAG: ATP-binding protein [Cyanobacteria bacterium P01_D01_bin.156]